MKRHIYIGLHLFGGEDLRLSEIAKKSPPPRYVTT